jgi:hypothetical protein
VLHPKIRSLVARWAAYPGYSYVLQSSRATRGGDQVFRDAPETRAFYAVVEDVLSGWDAALTRRSLALRLPPASYHVTFSDLVNIGNLRKVRPVERFGEAVADLDPDVAQAIAALPRSIALPRCRLQLSRLANRSNRVLILELAPADAEAYAAYGERYAWVSRALEGLSIQNQPFAPHLSVAYFADNRLAPDEGQIAEIDDQLRDALAGHVLDFDMADMMRFDTMVDWRPFI